MQKIRRIRAWNAMNPRHPLNENLECWLRTSVVHGGSATPIYDISGNANTATLVSGDYESGPLGQGGVLMALNYNGTTNRTQITPLVAHNATRTWAAWVRPVTTGEGAIGTVFDKLNSGTATIEALRFTAGNFRFIRGFSTTAGLWDMPAATLGAWSYITLSYDSSATANNPLYWLNGLPQTVTRTTAPVGTASTNASSYWLGNRGVADATWNGQLADVRIYDRTIIDDEEAYQLYDESSKFYSPIYNWRQQRAFFASNSPFLWWRKVIRLMRG